MAERQTLEEQIRQAKENDRKTYGERVIRAMQGERTYELYELLCNAPTFLQRSAVSLYTRIVDDYKSGKPTSAGDVRKAESVIEFAYLASLNLVEVQEQPYLWIFKRKIIVPKNISENISGI